MSVTLPGRPPARCCLLPVSHLIRNWDAFRYGKEDLQPCLTTQTLYRPPDHGVSHFQGQLLGWRVAWVWVVWPTVSVSLPPLQFASGGPASQWNSTPTAVRMSGGQELTHPSRIISDTGVTVRLWLCGG